MRKAVVIPSHRAEATLEGVIDTLPKRLFDEGGFAVIVNDCSPDDTGKVADRLAEKHEGVHVVHHEKNRGYGGALKSGMKRGVELGGEIFAVVHADGQYAPEMALQLCEPIEAGLTEIVQGSRMKGGARKGENPMPLSRYIPNRILTKFENLVVGTKMADFHSGYMIYSKRLLEMIPYEKLQDNYNFDAEMIIMAHIAGIKCAEIPIPTRYDDEVSSLKPIPYGLNVLKMMVNYTRGHYLRLYDEHTAEHPELLEPKLA